MPLDLPDFWATQTNPPPPLTAEMVSYAEKLLAVKLPPLLLELLRLQNGGPTNPFDYFMPNAPWGEDRLTLYELFGIVADEAGQGQLPTISILDTPYLIQEWGLPERQVLLCGEGHWWLTLDYRTSAQPAVIWLDADDGVELPVAPSFEAFLSGLVPAATELG